MLLDPGGLLLGPMSHIRLTTTGNFNGGSLVPAHAFPLDGIVHQILVCKWYTWIMYGFQYRLVFLFILLAGEGEFASWARVGLSMMILDGSFRSVVRIRADMVTIQVSHLLNSMRHLNPITRYILDNQHGSRGFESPIWAGSNSICCEVTH
jgi:hypothetical protein